MANTRSALGASGASAGSGMASRMTCESGFGASRFDTWDGPAGKHITGATNR